MYPYALAKWQGEKLIKHWSKVYNLPFMSLRFFNAYGPRSRTTGATELYLCISCQKLFNKPLTIVEMRSN